MGRAEAGDNVERFADKLVLAITKLRCEGKELGERLLRVRLRHASVSVAPGNREQRLEGILRPQCRNQSLFRSWFHCSRPTWCMADTGRARRS